MRVARLEAELNEHRRRTAAKIDNVDQMHPKLHSSEATYREIIESAVGYAIIATDVNGTIATWNKTAERVFGWSEREIVGRPLETIYSPEDVNAEVPFQDMRRSRTAGTARHERWYVKADGSPLFAFGETMPLYDSAETTTGYIKILREQTHEIIGQEDRAASRERLQLALDAAAIVGTFDWDVPGDKVWADDRFAAVFGVAPEEIARGATLERFVAGIHPDDRERVGRSVEDACKTGRPFTEEYRTINTEGQVRWVFCRGRCFQDEDGKPMRFPGAIVDITAEKERTLRQAALLRLGDDLFKELGPTEFSSNALSILGETLDVSRVGYATVDADGQTARIVDEWTAENVTVLTGSFDLNEFGKSFHTSLSGGLVTIEDIATHPATSDSSERFMQLSIRALVNITVVEHGEVRLIFYVHNSQPRPWTQDDIAFIREVLSRAWTYMRRRRSELTLHETETRLRLAHEAAEIGTFDYDLAGARLIWDKRCRAMFGIFNDVDVTYDDTFMLGVHPEDRARVNAAVDATLDPNIHADFDISYRTIGLEDGVIRHIQANGQTLVENGKTVRFVGAVRDITEERLSQEHQSLLTRELQHRVKNTLAMVIAIANQTMRRAANPEEGLQAFSARISALAKAHDILVQTSWTSAPMEDVVEQSLLIHRPGRAERLNWKGPAVMLNARQALALSLALHELATNATKYGALSNDEGSVDIRWSLGSRTQEGQGLQFEWRERGGPLVTSPDKRGFGSRLIQQSLSAEFGGSFDLAYESTGVVCAMEAILAK